LKKPNILFILIDTLRADRVFGENRTAITPTIDNLVKKSTCFTQATCSVHATISALGNLFSSKFSFKTGLGGKSYNELNFKQESFFNILSKNGYYNYCIVPDIVSHLGIINKMENSDCNYSAFQRLNDGLGTKIENSLKKNTMKEPWFFYIHLNELHSPVIAPKQFDQEKFGKNQYDRTVSATDSWLNKFIQHIDLKNTIIVLTSDHGQNTFTADFEPTSFQKIYWKFDRKIPSCFEPLKDKALNKIRTYKLNKKKNEIKFEEGKTFQSRNKMDARIEGNLDVFDDVIRVPLIFAGYNIPKNTIINQQVNHVDIIPTIEEICNFKFRLKDSDGVNLVDLMKGMKIEEKPIYIESPPRRKISNIHVIGIRTSQYKYFRDIDNAKNIVNLYDLNKDPEETINIAQNNPKIVAKMEEILQTYLKEQEKNYELKINNEELKEIEKELRKQGYI